MAAGALAGARLVGFLVLFGLFARDLALTAQTCLVDTRDWPPGLMLVDGCLRRTQAAARRLWWEIPALVVAGGLVGAALARWRRGRRG